MGQSNPIIYATALLTPSWAWILTSLGTWFPTFVQITAALAGTLWSLLMIWESTTVQRWRGVVTSPTTVRFDQPTTVRLETNAELTARNDAETNAELTARNDAKAKGDK